ncbi:DarT ssDNA thymidine ADP-ribosyltransferase family protein [uncultured Campylobacter sp.]|uniref:DarT ssDNA thymidine ADP-ribosyltransferase family protein n=1 Tax=uncultured Campylobacter sp. TaxID=218934 RepID=UPI00261EEB8A|nr:DarT ssDNA thymidine ADP-ribosyltransferase family protein [uncultured Campylobacter sp.]
MAIFQVTNIISTLEKLPLKNSYIYYIANLDDLSDIMSHGISAISTDPKRSHAEPIYGKAISEYVSLYFNPRNAALYSAQKSYGSKIIILQIHKTALLADGVIFTNASATATRYECANELSDLLNTQFISWIEVMSKGWNHVNKSIEQSKRDRMMAEALVPTHLPIDMIAGIICQDSSIAKSIASDYNIAAVADMEYFFPTKLYAPQSKDELMGLICDEDIYLGDIDTSAITDMSELFYKIRREDFSGIESWDVSNVTDMYMMFSERDNFNQPLNSWDVSSVTDMGAMFADCENFNQPLNSWDVSSVTDMSYMFVGCKNFNQPLDNWLINNPNADKIINEIYGYGTFEKARATIKPINGKYHPKYKWQLKLLTLDNSLNLGDIDTSAITDMSELFYGSEREDFSGIESWDVGSVTDMTMMFEYCINFNQPLNSWNVSSVVNMSRMFYAAKNFNQPLNNWDVSSVTNMLWMFRDCTNFNQPLNNWDVSSVTNMGGMFEYCKNFNQPLNNWDVSSVTNIREMFRNCKNFNQLLDSWRDKLSQELIDQLPLIYFVERKIVNNKTRYYPKTKDELESLVRVESLNLGDIDTGAITDMCGLFAWSERKDFSGIESWDVSSVTDMSEMFDGCKINDENKPKF